MKPYHVIIVFKGNHMECTKEFDNSLYAQLKAGETVEIDIQGNIIECMVTKIDWQFGHFGNNVTITVKQIPQNWAHSMPWKIPSKVL